jgi:hypothetical protein
MATNVYQISLPNNKSFFVQGTTYKKIWDTLKANNVYPSLVNKIDDPAAYANKTVIPVADFRQPPCRCKRLLPSSNTTNEAQFRCKCGQTQHVIKLNKIQRKELRKDLLGDKKDDIHGLYHKMMKTVGNGAGQGFSNSGYEMMGKMDKFVQKNPSIIACGVDDDYHASSDVFLIPHQNSKQFWGVTALYVPQCTGEKPIRFFLYPEHLKGLIAGLNEMAKRIKATGNKKLSTFWTNPKQLTSWQKADLPNYILKPKPEDLNPSFAPNKPLTKAQQKKLKAFGKKLNKAAK